MIEDIQPPEWQAMCLKLLTKEERKANKEKVKADTQFIKLLKRLDSGKEMERLAAATDLREQWPDGVKRLLTRYQSTTNLWKKRSKWLLFSLCWMVAGFAIDVYASHRGVHFRPLVQIITWPFTMLLIFYITAPKMRRDSIRYLLHFKDISMVGPLVDALGFHDEIIQQDARRTLTRLLPRLQASDAHLLNGEQREQLRQMLFTNYTELMVSILKAYEHIGDAAELEAVERLMQMPIWDMEVRDAAEACLPFLQLRAQQMQSSQTLLRASEHATPLDMLLRPAAHAPTEDETQLLRMSSSGH